MMLHRYLYVLNNPINDKDPTGELGIGNWITDRTDAIEAYNETVGAAFQSANSWEDVLDMAVAANTFREAYFGTKLAVNLLDPSKLKFKLKPAPGCIACVASVALSCGALCANDPVWNSQDDTWGSCTNKCMSFVFDPRKSFGPDSNIIIKGFVIGCAAACIIGI